MSEVLPFEPQGNFQEILEAVQETRRGRWFLDEYRASVHRSETEQVLSAIHKLEQAVARQSPATDVAQARQAIQATRERIARLGDSPTPPADPQLFRRLAALQAEAAQTAGPSPEAALLNQRIALALELVDQLDHTMGGATPAPAMAYASAPPPATLPGEQMRLFRHDEAVFAAPAAAPAQTESRHAFMAPLPAAPRGARLVIKKTTGPEPAAAAPVLPPEAVPLDVLAPEAEQSFDPEDDVPEGFFDAPEADVLEPERVADMALADIATPAWPEPAQPAAPVPPVATAPATDPAQRIVIIRRTVSDFLDETSPPAPQNNNAA